MNFQVHWTVESIDPEKRPGSGTLCMRNTLRSRAGASSRSREHVADGRALLVRPGQPSFKFAAAKFRRYRWGQVRRDMRMLARYSVFPVVSHVT